MVVESPPDDTTESSLAESPDAGVIEEARRRQRRHRGVGACVLLVVAAAAVIGSLSSGGGRGTAHGGTPVAKGGTAFVRGSALRLPRGRATTTFTINAPAEHPYDVTVTAPAASAIVLTMKIPAVTNDRIISPEAGWTVNTLSDPSCHTEAGHTSCLLHYAAGGNPGGRWTGIVHKTSLPAAPVHISVVFARQAGSYPG